MHFISTGRNERITRWISEQTIFAKSEEDERSQDEEELTSRREHDARADMNWAIEELEREMTFTAFACGKLNWRFSVNSVASSKLDIIPLKRLSQLSLLSSIIDQPVQSPNDGRRNARIVSNPPVLPPSPNGSIIELPQPILQRSMPPPPPITTTSPRSSNLPPIAFVLQESASPLPSAMHFTPAPDMDAFPSTPRSFSSFKRNSEDDSANVQELFLSPRIEHSPRILDDQAISPQTPYSLSQYYSGASDISTPSLSMFPATPGSPYAVKTAPWKYEEIPPVPELPKLSPKSTPPVNVDKDLPPSPQSFAVNPSGSFLSPSKPPNLPKQIDAPVEPGSPPRLSHENLRRKDQDEASLEEASNDSIGDDMSSRLSVFSSRFSLSSVGSGSGGRRRLFQLGKGPSRSRAGSVSTLLNKSHKHTRTRSHSTAGGTVGHSRNPSVLTGSINSRSNSRLGTNSNSRAGSSLGMHSRAGSRAGMITDPISRADARAGASTPTSVNQPSSCLSRNGSFPSPCAPIQEQALATSEGQTSFLSMLDDEPQKTTKMRNFVSRWSLKRSKSSGNITPSRPPRSAPPLPLNGPGIGRAHSSGPSISSTCSPIVPAANTRLISRPQDTATLRRGVPLTPLAMPISPASVPLPPTPAVGCPPANVLSSLPLKSVDVSVPKTPSSANSFFGSGDAPGKDEAEFLVVKGVERDKRREENIKKWCESWGTVKHIVRVRSSGNIVIEFKNKDVIKQIVPQEIYIADVGTVNLSWTR